MRLRLEGIFLRNSDNKRAFYPYVVGKMISMTMFQETIVVRTNNEKAITNYKGNIFDVNVPDCWHVEADTPIVLPVLNCIQSGINNIIVRSNDIDVIVLLIAYMPVFIESNSSAKITAMCDVESLSINEIALYIGLEKMRRLAVFSFSNWFRLHF